MLSMIIMLIILRLLSQIEDKYKTIVTVTILVWRTVKFSQTFPSPEANQRYLGPSIYSINYITLTLFIQGKSSVKEINTSGIGRTNTATRSGPTRSDRTQIQRKRGYSIDKNGNSWAMFDDHSQWSHWRYINKAKDGRTHIPITLDCYR